MTLSLWFLDPLTITDLYRINVDLIDVVYPWEFGRALGLKKPTLEKIRSRYTYLQHIERCFTEVLAAWLNGEDRPHGSPGPNWKEVVCALRSVDMREYAHRLMERLASEW